MKDNIAIRTQSGRVVDSQDFWGFAIGDPPHEIEQRKKEQEQVRQHSPVAQQFRSNPGKHLSIVACVKESNNNVTIHTFHSESLNEIRNKAVNALSSLFQAINNGEDYWEYKEQSDETSPPSENE